MQIIPFQTLSADGSITQTYLDDPSRPELQLFAQGTFGGGTIQLYYTIDGGVTYVAVAGATLTSNGVIGNIRCSRGERFRITLTGATAPTISVGLLEAI